MAHYLYSELSRTVDAYHRCTSKPEQYGEWTHKHAERVNELVRAHMPSGAGFDSGTQLDLDASHADKLVFTTSFHHMDEAGYYDGWTDHTVTVVPSLAHRYHIRVGGRNRNDIKDYIAEQFGLALQTELE